MYIILNRANLVVCITSNIKRVKQQENGLIALAREGEAATAIYATDNDSFYPIVPSDPLGVDTYRAVEVNSVPDDVVPGYWYYTGEFFTTPEKEAEYAATKEQENINRDIFLALAELGEIIAEMGG